MNVHREYYRLPSTALEVAKVGKLLCAFEEGIAKHAGKRLDEIQLSDIEGKLVHHNTDVLAGQGLHIVAYTTI
jgi:hypothetical protein